MSYWARLRHSSQEWIAASRRGGDPAPAEGPVVSPAAAPSSSAYREDPGERIRMAFGPSQPVENREHLLGREQEIDRLFDITANLRSHALVFGARGAGKTSLVRAFGDHADERGMLVVYLSCGAGGGFASTFRPYLDFLPISLFPRDEEADVRRAIAALPADFDARALAGILSRIEGRDVIFIVDEFDRVDGAAIRGEIASLVKLLSDMRARVLIVFVGIARNVHELIDGHASLRRHLVALRVRGLDHDAVTAFFEQGERVSGLIFPADVRALIASLARGSPYHLRLFAMHAAFCAVRAGEAILSQAFVVAGLRIAFDNWASVNPGTAAMIERHGRKGKTARRQLLALGLIALEQERFTVDELQSCFDADDGAAGIAAVILDEFASMLTIVDAAGAMQFDDPLAPQFLLLSCCLADEGEERPVLPAPAGNPSSKEHGHAAGLS